MTHVVEVIETPPATVSTVDSPTSVDTALEDVIVQTAQTITTVGVSPYVIINEGGGTGELTLLSSTSIGATTAPLDNAPPFATGQRVIVAIDPYTANCEIRKVQSVSGSTLTLESALVNAHSAGAVVSIPDVFTPLLWGGTGNGSSNDHTAVQEALYQLAQYSGAVWLEGLNKIWAIGQPLMLSTSNKMHEFNPKALASFAPAETNNAMGMSYGGNVRTFTADPATDILTTPTAHGLPADNIGVVFQGSALPGGLTAGKFYYCRDRTTTTFKVSTTSGGAAVDITSAGSGGRVYCEVYASNAKTTFDDSYWDGALVTGLNGLLLSIQQQGYANKLRVDNYDGVGIRMKGQQYICYNLELIKNRRAIELDDMSELYVYGLNMEQFNEGIYTASGGAFTSAFYGVHIESAGVTYGVSNEIAVFLDNGGDSLTFDNVQISGSSTATFLKADAASANATSYSIRGLKWAGGIASAGQTMVNDVNRGISLDQWTDCRGYLHSFDAPRLPSSQSFDDPNPIVIAGPGGRRIYMGAQNDDKAQIRIRGGHAQTGRLTQWDDTSGNEMLGVNVAGELILKAGPRILTGTGTPEGAVTAVVGSIFTRSDGGTGTTLYRKESGSGNTGWVPVSNAGASPIMHVTVLPGSTLTNAFVWTNMPAAETILLGVNTNRFGLDLTNYTQMRWSFWLNVTGFAGSKLFVQYSTTENGTYAAIDGSTGTELAIDSGGTARKRSSWVNLASGAKADIYVRVAGSGGDATVDPGFGTMYLEFR